MVRLPGLQRCVLFVPMAVNASPHHHQVNLCRICMQYDTTSDIDRRDMLWYTIMQVRNRTSPPLNRLIMQERTKP